MEALFTELILGDCLEAMADLEPGSVDMVMCDPPYGTTACKWDSVIPFGPMWTGLKRVVKPNGAIVLMASQPFTSALIMSNPTKFRHAWVWHKVFAANGMQAMRQPMKTVEDVLVFSLGSKGPNYNPIMEDREKPIKLGKASVSKGAIPNRSTLETLDAIRGKIYNQKCPSSILTFNVRKGNGLHPTQKPVDLMAYLIRTYSNVGETVLDFTMGSGTTGVAAVQEGRSFVGIEMDEAYFEVARVRIEQAEVENDWRELV